MARRLQFFVQPPDVHGTEQAAVVHGVLQPVLYTPPCMISDKSCGDWRRIRLAQSDQVSL